MGTNKVKTFLIITAMILTTSFRAGALELEQSQFDKQVTRMRAEYSVKSLLMDTPGTIDVTEMSDGSEAFEDDANWKPKSPLKAFLLSAAVPGLGQYYYGSRMKPFVFLGTEVAAWVFYSKWHSQGNTATDEFNAFADLYWSEVDYVDYLHAAYGDSIVTDHDVTEKEVSHHLPTSKTQQYYEMIGKYDQFSWGWDDAFVEDSLGAIFTDPWLPVNSDANTPSSKHRDTYEDMRHDANSRFDKADKMIMVSMANRLISAFEAFFSTKSINKTRLRGGKSYGRIQVRAKLKSYTTVNDTPYLNLTFKF